MLIHDFENNIEYDLGDRIGQGSFANVYEATNINSDEKVALKIINKSKLTSNSSVSIKTEVDILALLDCNHDNVLCYYYTFTDEHNMYIVTKLVENSVDLSDLDVYAMKPEIVINIMYEITLGCKYIADKGIVHLDLKPKNIVISMDNLKPIIIDFGLSCLMEGVKGCKKIISGTPSYISPDIISREKDIIINQTTDIYSLGLIFYNMISEPGYNTRALILKEIIGSIPKSADIYRLIPKESTHNSITSLMALHIKNEYKLLTDLVISMISFNQLKRPSYDEILSTLKKVKDSIHDNIEGEHNEDDTIIEKLKI